MKQPKLVAGNWKMNGSRASNQALLEAVVAGIVGLPGVECAVCVPFPYLGEVAEQLRASPVAWGAQNVSEHARGAYTGEVSAAMLVEFGCRYAIVGHSERRQLYGETDAQVAGKFAAALDAKLTPILCVGETDHVRKADGHIAHCRGQLDGSLAKVPAAAIADMVVAYEPVWAIGTGQVATPKQAQEVHAMIRERLRSKDPGVAEGMRILYGGSVKPDNARELNDQADIDGSLVGGASLKAADFIAIVRATRPAQ